MNEKKSRKVYLGTRKVNDFKELIETTTKLFPDNIAYKFKKNVSAKDPEYIEIKYSQVKEDVEALGTKLLNMGLEGKNIAVIGKNRYEWCISYFAVTTSNMIVVPLDRALPENEIKSLLTRSEAEAVIFDESYKDLMLKLKEDKTNKVSTLICMDKEETEILTIDKLIEDRKKLLKSGDTKYQEIEIDNKKMSILLFTSGTTNEAKGVMLSQYNICSNINSISSWVRLYPTDTLLSFLPIHHTFECTITFLYGFYSGCTIAFCDGLKYIQKNLAEYKVSVFVAVPLVLETMYKKIQKAIDDKGKTKLINTLTKVSNALLKCKIDLRKVFFKQILDNFGGKLRIVLYGSAPMDKNTIVGYNNLGIPSIQGYGLTETSPVVTAETDKEKRPGSVGLPFDELDIKIEEEDKDGVGEIVVKGPSVMMGYYKNEDETKKSMKDGWFKTGDYGYIDKDGFLFITGRKKDIIVLRNGKNVYPQEIEFLLNKVPYIAESMVYQREQSKTDTMLCAKIVYDKDVIEEQLGKKSEEEYKEEIWKQVKEINKQLPIYKHIKNITITTTPLAKTTTQKVKRYEELKNV